MPRSLITWPSDFSGSLPLQIAKEEKPKELRQIQGQALCGVHSTEVTWECPTGKKPGESGKPHYFPSVTGARTLRGSVKPKPWVEMETISQHACSQSTLNSTAAKVGENTENPQQHTRLELKLKTL